MKKYWKTIFISLVIVMTISLYYIQTVIASKNDDFLTIETTKGSNEEIEHLILEGGYNINNFYRGGIYISKESTRDQINRSFIDRVLPTYVPFMLQQHVKDYRNFMRGKDINLPTKFNESTERLVYSTILNDKVLKGDDLTIQIDILDKNTKDHSSFEVSTSAHASYDWIYIRDVYVENGKIKVLTTIHVMNGGEELHLYTVDENKKELVQDLVIVKVMRDDRTAIRIYNDENSLQNEDYFIYMLEPYGEGAGPDITPSQMYVYHFGNDEIFEWTIPAEFKPYLHMTITHGAYVYIPVPSAQGLELNRYNVEKMVWEEPLFFMYPRKASDKEIPTIEFNDNKIYLVNRILDENVVIIGDLNTGDALYEGKITGEIKDQDYPLYIRQLYIMN